MSGITTGNWWAAGSPACDWPWLPGLLRGRTTRVLDRTPRARRFASGNLFAGWKRFAGWNLLRFARLPSGDAAQPVSGEDARDIRECLEGDEDAYARLVRRYQQSIANYMWRFTQDAVAWEELTHEVFVQAYFSLSKFRGRSPWLHWLKKIATRVGYGYWRQRQRDRERGGLSLELVAETAVAVVDRELHPRESHELVQRLLEQVSPRDRLVLTLTYLESQSTEEIAALTGWSRTLVKVQLHRARQRLARISQSMGINW